MKNFLMRTVKCKVSECWMIFGRVYMPRKSFKISDTIIQLTELMHGESKQCKCIKVLWFRLSMAWLCSLQNWICPNEKCWKWILVYIHVQFLAKKLAYFSFVLPFDEATGVYFAHSFAKQRSSVAKTPTEFSKRKSGKCANDGNALFVVRIPFPFPFILF